MEDFFHHIRSKVFKQAGRGAAEEKESDRINGETREPDKEKGAKTVNRTIGAIKKAAVDEATFGNRADEAFVEPAKKTINEKPEKNSEKIDAHGSDSREIAVTRVA